MNCGEDGSAATPTNGGASNNRQIRTASFSGPIRQVASILLSLIQVGRLDLSIADGLGDDPGGSRSVSWFDTKALSQGCIGHSSMGDEAQASVLVTGSNAIFGVHVSQFLMREKRRLGGAQRSLEIGRGQLVHLDLLNHLVDTRTAFLANPHAPHESR